MRIRKETPDVALQTQIDVLKGKALNENRNITITELTNRILAGVGKLPEDYVFLFNLLPGEELTPDRTKPYTEKNIGGVKTVDDGYALDFFNNLIPGGKAVIGKLPQTSSRK